MLVRRQVKITSESDTIERRDDGPVTRVVPRFIIVPNFLSGAFLFEKATGADRQRALAPCGCRQLISLIERGKK